MKRFKYGILLLLIMVHINFLISCDKENPSLPQPAWQVFKYKEGINYIDYVPVYVDSSRKLIIGYPSYKDVAYLLNRNPEPYKNYFLGFLQYGFNTGYLGITIEEFDNIDDTLTKAGCYGLIIEWNPFQEFYIDEQNYLKYNPTDVELQENTSYPSVDTALFHDLVDSNELSLYLKQVI